MIITVLYTHPSNKYMHALDVFEPTKICVEGFKAKSNWTKKNYKKPFEQMKEGCLKEGRELVFAWFDWRPIYFKKDVNVISTWEKFGMFKDFLEWLWYEVETDEHMCVTKVT